MKKLQEYENKLKFLEECLKEKKESLELITSDYIKVVHDMKQVHQLQDLKIFKYESDIKILEEEAKMENRIKGIKEGQLEWAKRELKRHNTENTILQKRTNDHAFTVKNLDETLNLTIKINAEKGIPHRSAAPGTPEDSTETAFVRVQPTKTVKQNKQLAKPSLHSLLRQPLKRSSVQPAVTRKRSHTKAETVGDDPTVPSKVIKLSDYSEIEKYSPSDPELAGVPGEKLVRKTGVPAREQAVGTKSFTGQHKRLVHLKVAPFRPFTSGKSSIKKFGVEWNISKGGQAKVMKFPKLQMKCSLSSFPKFLLRTPWEGSSSSSKESLRLAGQGSSENAFPNKSPSEPSVTLGNKEVDGGTARHDQGDWGSVGRREQGQEC